VEKLAPVRLLVFPLFFVVATPPPFCVFINSIRMIVPAMKAVAASHACLPSA